MATAYGDSKFSAFGTKVHEVREVAAGGPVAKCGIQLKKVRSDLATGEYVCAECTKADANQDALSPAVARGVALAAAEESGDYPSDSLVSYPAAVAESCDRCGAGTYLGHNDARYCPKCDGHPPMVGRRA